MIPCDRLTPASLSRARQWVRARTALCALALTCLGTPFAGRDARAQAANDYPARPVTLIAPFSAGGDADIAARNLAVAAQTALGQPIVVVNRAGASGAIGSLAVKLAKPDGYTLLLARVGSQVLVPALQPDAGYRFNDFTVIGLLEVDPVICAVRADSPIASMKDLANALRASPGKLNYSTSGPATVLNLAPQLFFDTLGLAKEAAVQVAYKGGGEAAMAVLSGDADFSCGNLTSMLGQVKSGKIRGLVVTTAERLKELPDVPAANESGYPQLAQIVGWSALYGPPGLPRTIVDAWARVLQRAAGDARWVSVTEGAGGVARVLSPADTEKFAADQFTLYDRLGKKLQLKLQ